MHESKHSVSAIAPRQFTDILHDLATVHKEISIRLHLNGELWMEHFASVLVFSKHATLLTHLPTRTVINVPDLTLVTGFEIDRQYKLFFPFHHYYVGARARGVASLNNGFLYA